jgi:hypothetical protein
LGTGLRPAEARLWQAFRLGLRERGWIEGQNILIEFRRPRATTLDFPNSRPTWFGSRWTDRGSGLHIVQAAKEATSSIPIVF